MRSIVLVRLVTLDGTKTHKLVLEGLFGTVYRATSTKKLIDKNQLSKLTIKCLVLKHNEKDRRQIKGATYLEEMEHIVGKRVRNNFIRNLALSTCTGNTLILFQYVEKHGKPLYDEIVEKANDGRKVFLFMEEQRQMTEKEYEQLPKSWTTRLLSLLTGRSALVSIFVIYTTLFLVDSNVRGIL